MIAALYWAGPAKVWAVLSKADIRFIAAAITLAIPMVLIKGIRWEILLRGYDINLGFRESTSMYATGMIFSAVTPGRIGDMVKIILLMKKGSSIGKAVACNVLDRLYDVAFVVLAGYAGMWYFSGQFTSQLHIVNIVFIVAIALLFLFMLKRHLFKRLAIRLIPAQYRSVVRDSWNEIIGAFWENQKTRILPLIGCTITFWFIQLSAIYLCGLGLGLDVSFIYLSACAVIATALSLTPITIAGIGTRDAVFILLLGQIGIAREESLALSSIALAVYLLNCVVFYLFSVIFKSD